MPANGDSTASAMSPVATRQRPCQSKTYSPPGPLLVAASRQADPALAGLGPWPRRDLHLVEPGVAQALGDRGADDDRIAGRHERPVARCEREDGVDRRRRSAAGPRRAGRRRRSRVASRSRSRSATTRAARRAGRPDPGSRSGTSRRSTSSPPSPPATSIAKWRPRAPEPDRCRGTELGDRRTSRAAGRSARGRRASGRAGSSRRSPWTTSEPALRPARRPAGVTTVPSGASRSSSEVGDHRPPLVRVRDRAERREHAGRGRGRTGRRPAGGGRRRGRARRPVPARRPRRRRSRRSGRPAAGRPIPASIRRAGRAPPGRRPSGA